MTEMHKDPVCGMTVFAERAFTANWRAQTVYFCSEFCRQRFLARPESYQAALVRPVQEEAKESRQIAYFSMEVAVGASMPTYSGGLGVLAGDTLKSCADLRVPIVGVTLLSRKGYREREGWIEVMRHAIALNASYFNSHRMVQQYVTNAYLA